jgi:transcriptional regulator with GAF, ATPase, and Fis domain
LDKVALPSRYEPERRLGQGGGGEVWAVRERHGNRVVALKVLARGYGAAEVDALIREAVALSGLEGLGLPQVLDFGRLRDGRPFLVRELVPGESLEQLADAGQPAPRLLDALVRAADVLTHVHRSGLLHGDVKPANVIVTPDGAVSLVDLGLAAPWREGGALPEGLTPHYAAPEILSGQRLTARSEVYSLGVMLREIVDSSIGELAPKMVVALREIARRATVEDPAGRYPSADELASAVRHAAGIAAPTLAKGDERWPVEGIDQAANALLSNIDGLAQGTLLSVVGPEGSGRSTLLRRAAWTLSMRGEHIALLDEGLARDVEAAAREIDSLPEPRLVLVDAPSEGLAPRLRERLSAELAAGARVVVTDAVGQSAEVGPTARRFEMPPLDEAAGRRLLRRAIPSLSETMVRRVLEATGLRPGPLRRFVARAGAEPIASEGDLERLLSRDVGFAPPTEPRAAAGYYLDHGRFRLARAALDELGVHDLDGAWLEARYQVAAGTAERALSVLTEAVDRWGSPEGELAAYFTACRARALLGVGRYQEALQSLEGAEAFPTGARLEALAYRGLGQSLAGDRELAIGTLTAALTEAREAKSARYEALVASSLATAQWRLERLEAAASMFRVAIAAAEQAGDAGLLSSAQINLAALLKVQGELAAAMDMLEAAVDSARRSGRRTTLHQALLNLANADLYLGRLERVRGAIAAVEGDENLPAVSVAQLTGLHAELADREGRLDRALELYAKCEEAWLGLGRKRDAAEAALEGVLVGARIGKALEERFARARTLLGDGAAQSPLFKLAEARLALTRGDDAAAERACSEAIQAAERSGQREELWRGSELSAELEERAGRSRRARQARERALEVLEDISARLPRDLREVYWNDPRRRALRDALHSTELSLGSSRGGAAAFAAATAVPSALGGRAQPSAHVRSGAAAISRMTQTPLEQRLANILAINHDLAGEIDLDRLCQKIVTHAAELLGAERAFLLLGSGGQELTVRAAFGSSGTVERQYSRSIAERVLESGEPLLSVDAAHDGRLAGFASVHQLSLRGVASVPVQGPLGATIGALYLETRGAPGARFADELPSLRAFADQAAIALENARLLAQVKERSLALEASNRALEDAQARLREVLEARTARLKEVRRELRSTRLALTAHYTYEGLVGTSPAMRRIYAMIERIKDTDIPVLITGESGTGKEVVAQAIHKASPRSDKRFLGVNCGAIPEQILESELFGHTRGAFTGADRDRKGLFREAEGGSLLLDEIGETPAKMQAGLLRVLQEKRVRPVGGQKEEPVDVRVIFATNRDLSEMVRQGRFREDLFYRIQVVQLHLPALRDRSDDIPQLVDHFFSRFATRFDQPKKSLSREALARLLAYEWPGNVRQLENVLLNAWVLSEGDTIEGEDLELPRERVLVSPARSLEAAAVREAPQAAEPRRGAPPSSREARPPRRQTVSQHRRDEKQRIVEALESCNWNRVRAAEILGMPRRTFYRRLAQYGIQ